MDKLSVREDAERSQEVDRVQIHQVSKECTDTERKAFDTVTLIPALTICFPALTICFPSLTMMSESDQRRHYGMAWQ